MLKKLLFGLIIVFTAVSGTSAQDGGENLISNSDFSARHNGWEPVIGTDCTACTLEIQSDTSTSGFILAWDRANSQGSGNAAYVHQVIDRDVSEYDALVVDLTFMVMHHNLPNSGWWSDQNNGSGEYPVKLTLRFYDAQENLFEWSHGFLATHDGSTILSNYTLVTPGQWIDFQRDLLTPETWVDPRGAPLPQPVILHDVMIGGYGWDFGGALRYIAVTGYRSDSNTTGSSETGGALTGQGTGGGQTQSGETGNGFIVEEYALVPADQDSPTHFEFRDYVSSAVLDVRRAWREMNADANRLAAINQVLGNWDYALQRNENGSDTVTYTLSHQGSPLITDVTTIWPLTVNASGTAFQLLLDSRTQPTLVVTQDTIGEFDTSTFAYLAPVYVGDDLVQIVADWSAPRFDVVRAGETVYTVIPDGPFVEPPTKALHAWNGQWVLEVEGDIIIGGTSLNQQMGYGVSFGWRLIAGQPFYVFSQGDQLALSYAGEIVDPYRYDEIVHYRCCEESMFNLQGNDTMVWFYALKEGVWHYVEAGVYE